MKTNGKLFIIFLLLFIFNIWYWLFYMINYNQFNGHGSTIGLAFLGLALFGCSFLSWNGLKNEF